MAIIIVQVQSAEGITCSGIRFAIGGYNNMWCARTLWVGRVTLNETNLVNCFNYILWSY